MKNNNEIDREVQCRKQRDKKRNQEITEIIDKKNNCSYFNV